MTEDIVSFIIPIYKTDNNYLNECLKSICKQTYKAIEVIVVNDGMTRENLKLVNEYQRKDSRIKVIGEKNEGVSSARNKGINEAIGKWIVFVDSDDFIDENFCEKMLDIAIKEKSQCVICGHNRIYSNKKEVVLKRKSFSMTGEKFFNEIFTVQSGLGVVTMKIWNADVLKKENIRFDKQLKVAEDALFCMQISGKIEKIYYFSEPLYNYRYNAQSVVRKFDEEYEYKYLLAMKKTKKYIEQMEKKSSIRLYNYIAYHVLLIIINYCFHPENKENNIESVQQVCNIPEFEEAIRKATYEGFSLTRKITLFTLKHKLYFLTCIIAKIRQAQFKR